jgi:Domain of unknown function (DUF5916)
VAKGKWACAVNGAGMVTDGDDSQSRRTWTALGAERYMPTTQNAVSTWLRKESTNVSRLCGSPEQEVGCIAGLSLGACSPAVLIRDGGRPLRRACRGYFQATRWLTLLISVCLCMLSPAHGGDGPRKSGRRITVHELRKPPLLRDFLQMKPDQEFQRQMSRVERFVQRNPADGAPASQATDVYLGYDSKNLYAVFVCFDSDPSKIRAHLAPREQIFDDDRVVLYLDTFRDQRHAYIFSVNPLGVQADGVRFEGQGEDYSFDTLWYSEGKRTAGGYVVRMAIPFKSLRFPARAKQTWGIAVGRVLPRYSEDSYWPYVTTRVLGFIQQFAELEGLEGVTPSRSIEVIPHGSLLSSRDLDLRDPAHPRFADRSARMDAGFDSKFVLKNSVVLDTTVEPDFSQIESDSPQVTVNQRFEVFFPEKRPFFLENASYFQTPINLLFTRRIADPQFGARLTGKMGAYSVGALLADDRSPGEVVPPSDPLSGSRAHFAVMRLYRDLFDLSGLGMIYTDREFQGSYNRVGGIDGQFKLNETWVATFQGVDSFTRNLDGSSLAGPAFELNLSRSGRSFNYGFSYNDRSPGFRAESGYIPRSDIRDFGQSLQYVFHPDSKVLLSWAPVLSATHTSDYEGNTLDWTYVPEIQAQFPGQSYVYGGFIGENELLRPVDFPVLKENLSFSKGTGLLLVGTNYLRVLNLQLDYRWGQAVNYVPPDNQAPFLSNQTNVAATLTLRPPGPLQIDNTYLLSRLQDRESGISILENQILRSKWNFQFTREFSLRLIGQYNSVFANSQFTSLDTIKNFNADLLLTYLLHPGTAIYMGYNSDLQNIDPSLIPTSTGLLRTPNALLNDSRQIFVKVSYRIRF